MWQRLVDRVVTPFAEERGAVISMVVFELCFYNVVNNLIGRVMKYEWMGLSPIEEYDSADAPSPTHP